MPTSWHSAAWDPKRRRDPIATLNVCSCAISDVTLQRLQGLRPARNRSSVARQVSNSAANCGNRPTGFGVIRPGCLFCLATISDNLKKWRHAPVALREISSTGKHEGAHNGQRMQRARPGAFFSTDSVPVRDRLPYLREALGRSTARVDLGPVEGRPVSWWASLNAFDGLGIISGKTDGITCRRTRPLLADERRFSVDDQFIRLKPYLSGRPRVPA